MMFDYEGMKKHIEASGLKQGWVAKQADLSESTLSQILSGNRRCETNEYARLCAVLGVEVATFIRLPSDTNGQKGA